MVVGAVLLIVNDFLLFLPFFFASAAPAIRPTVTQIASASTPSSAKRYLLLVHLP